MVRNRISTDSPAINCFLNLTFSKNETMKYNVGFCSSPKLICKILHFTKYPLKN